MLAPRLSVSGNNGAPASREVGLEYPTSNSKPSMIAAQPGGLEPPPTLQASGFVRGRRLEVFIN
jgi:hypothetical protein